MTVKRYSKKTQLLTLIISKMQSEYMDMLVSRRLRAIIVTNMCSVVTVFMSLIKLKVMKINSVILKRKKIQIDLWDNNYIETFITSTTKL